MVVIFTADSSLRVHSLVLVVAVGGVAEAAAEVAVKAAMWKSGITAA
jgi:hypothetical protein